MVVKSAQRRARTFKGVRFWVGAIGERMMITLMTLQKGQAVGTHCHPNEQIGYCVSGRYTLTIDGKSTLVEQDDSYVIPGGASHSYQVLDDAVAVEVFSPPREDYR